MTMVSTWTKYPGVRGSAPASTPARAAWSRRTPLPATRIPGGPNE